MQFGQRHHGFKITQATAGITLAQPCIKGLVAVAGKAATIVEWAIDGKHAACRQMCAHQLKHALHQRPGHDVAGIAGKHSVKPRLICWRGPGAGGQIKLQRRTQIGRGLGGMPCLNAGVVIGQVAGLPGQLRQARRKVHAVLAGTRANLQHMSAALQCRLQHRKNGGLVVFASLRKRQLGVWGRCVVHGGRDGAKILHHARLGRRSEVIRRCQDAGLKRSLISGRTPRPPIFQL